MHAEDLYDIQEGIPIVHDIIANDDDVIMNSCMATTMSIILNNSTRYEVTWH